MPAYTIPAKQSLCVFGQGSDNVGGCYVKNTGLTAIEIRSSAGASGFMLDVGSSVSWSGSLWLYSDFDGAAFVDQSIGASFDASAVAAQIMGQGLAQSIAQQISLSGVPTIDRPNLLFQDSVTISAFTPGNFGPFIAGYVDVSAYSSLRISVKDTPTTPNTYNQFRNINVYWRMDPYTEYFNDTFVIYCNGGLATINLPIKAPYMRISYDDIGVTTDMRVAVYTSYVPAPKPAFMQDCAHSEGNFIAGMGGSVQQRGFWFRPSADGNLKVGGCSGRVRISLCYPTVAGMDLRAFTALSGVQQQPVLQMTAIGQVVSAEIVQGFAPLSFYWYKNSGTYADVHIEWLDN